MPPSYARRLAIRTSGPGRAPSALAPIIMYFNVSGESAKRLTKGGTRIDGTSSAWCIRRKSCPQQVCEEASSCQRSVI